MLIHPHILLVDSDTTFRRMVAMLIKRHYPHASVSGARNQHDALRQVPCFAPGLILTEIDLSGRRVLDLPRKMRALYPEAVVAVLTSYDLPEYREAAFQAGARYFISKSLPSGPAILAMVAQELSPSSPNLADARKGFHHARTGRMPAAGQSRAESAQGRDRPAENARAGKQSPEAVSKRAATAASAGRPRRHLEPPGGDDPYR
jgi:DNA-binding NarL/FixJ family response regulator